MKMYGNGDHYVKQSKVESKDKYFMFSNLEKNIVYIYSFISFVSITMTWKVDQNNLEGSRGPVGEGKEQARIMAEY